MLEFVTKHWFLTTLTIMNGFALLMVGVFYLGMSYDEWRYESRQIPTVVEGSENAGNT